VDAGVEKVHSLHHQYSMHTSTRQQITLYKRYSYKELKLRCSGIRLQNATSTFGSTTSMGRYLCSNLVSIPNRAHWQQCYIIKHLSNFPQRLTTARALFPRPSSSNQIRGSRPQVLAMGIEEKGSMHFNIIALFLHHSHSYTTSLSQQTLI
jgi:hypothetical protein